MPSHHDPAPESRSRTVLDAVVILPIADTGIAIVGVSLYGMTLFLDPVEEVHGHHFELELTPPIGLKNAEGEWSIERPGDASLIEHLVGQGIAQATAAPSGELLIDTNHGTRLSSTQWQLVASDGRTWTPQVGGGVALWTGARGPRRILEDQELGAQALASRGRRKDRIGSTPDGTTPTDVPTAEAEGLRIRALEVDDERGVHLTLVEPESPNASQTSEPSWLDSARFFATLRADDYAIPPDPDLFQAMSSVDFLLPKTIFVTFRMPLDSSGRSVHPSVGSGIVSASVGHDGKLTLTTTDGTIAGLDWGWSTAEPRQRWSSEGGRIEHYGSDLPRLRPEDAIQLATAWLEHDLTGRDDRFWAWERVNDLVQDDALAGWAMVRLLIAGAGSERQFGAIGAGPFEDLLNSHGDQLIDLIVDAASIDPQVRQTLAGVWKSSIDDEVWRRIESVLGRARNAS